MKTIDVFSSTDADALPLWSDDDEATYQRLLAKEAANPLPSLPTVEEIAGIITEDPNAFNDMIEAEILPLGERVLVELVPVASTTTIVLPEGVSASGAEARHAIVVAVGPEVEGRVKVDDIVFLPRGAKVGDWIGEQLLLPIAHIGAIIRQK